MKTRGTVNLYGVMAAGLAGLVAGAAVGGIGGRLAMRAVAVISGLPPSFSVEGTLGIVVIAAILGLIAGTIYGAVRPFVPLQGLAKGLTYGVVLAGLIALPFTQAPEGELALVSPGAGAALFAPIGLLFGFALEAVLFRWDDHRASRPWRPVSLVWLGLVAFFLGLALLNMATLMEEFVRFPPAASDAYLAAGLDFQRAHQLHGVLMLVFAASYTVLVVAILWMSAGQWIGSLAALSLAVLAAGWFSAAPYPTPVLTVLPAVSLLPGLVKAGGLALLILVMLLWPDGRFQPGWTRATFAAWCIWLVAWLLTPIGYALPQPLTLAITALGLSSGLLALGLRRRSEPARRRQVTPVLVGYGLAIGWFLALWGAAVLHPALGVHRATLPGTLFAFAPYLLPWLLLPTSLVVATKYGMEVASEAPGTTADQQRVAVTDASGAR